MVDNNRVILNAKRVKSMPVVIKSLIYDYCVNLSFVQNHYEDTETISMVKLLKRVAERHVKVFWKYYFYGFTNLINSVENSYFKRKGKLDLKDFITFIIFYVSHSRKIQYL